MTLKAYNNETEQHDREIPQAPYYVTSIDTFMSGWGPCRGGKKNKVIVPCPTMEDAKRVAKYARSRGDQELVEIKFELPNPLYSRFVYSLACGWVETSKKVEA